MNRYASATVVPVVRSRGAIEDLLRAHGATAFAFGWNETHDTLQFTLFQRTIRFTLPRPDRNDRQFTKDRHGYTRAASAQQKLYDQADRQRWRALYLVIRAKIEAVEAGIAVFEQEFLAYVVTDNGQTIGDILVPRLQAGTQLALTE